MIRAVSVSIKLRMFSWPFSCVVLADTKRVSGCTIADSKHVFSEPHVGEPGGESSWMRTSARHFISGGYDYSIKKGYTKNDKGETVLIKNLLAGGLAGNVGAFLASPLFLVKTHMQGKAAQEIAFGYQHTHTGMWGAFKTIFEAHGVSFNVSE